MNDMKKLLRRAKKHEATIEEWGKALDVILESKPLPEKLVKRILNLTGGC